MFVVLKLVEIIETKFILQLRKKNVKDSAFKVCKHKGKCESFQLNPGLRGEWRLNLVGC